MKYEIGTKFIGQGKRKDIYTIVDILSIYSEKEKRFIDIKYICEHEFCNQIIKSEHTQTTLDRAKFDGRIIK